MSFSTPLQWTPSSSPPQVSQSNPHLNNASLDRLDPARNSSRRYKGSRKRGNHPHRSIRHCCVETTCKEASAELWLRQKDGHCKIDLGFHDDQREKLAWGDTHRRFHLVDLPPWSPLPFPFHQFGPKRVECRVRFLTFSKKYPLALAACVIIIRKEIGMARLKEAYLNGYLNMFR